MCKIVVYTAITGNYDNIKPLSYVNTNFDYLCFTDYEYTGVIPEPWKQIRMPPAKWCNKDLARYIKMNVHEILPNYEASVWIDGNIDIINNIEGLVFDALKKGGASSYQHWGRNNINEEMIECAKIGYDSIFILLKQMKQYGNEGFISNELYETNVLIRDHTNSTISEFSKIWWEQYMQYGKRDQYAFTYAAWKSGLNIHNLGRHDPRFIKKYFSYFPHKNGKSIKLYRIKQLINKITNRITLRIIKM